jgi:hypothetical protein
MLVTDGYLIDIHPNGEPVEFTRPLGAGDHPIGHLQESDDYIEYRQTDEALEVIVEKGMFCVEQAGEFEFRTYADSFDELKDFLDANWSDAIITEEVATSAHRLEEDLGVGTLFLREGVKIGLLKRL